MGKRRTHAESQARYDEWAKIYIEQGWSIREIARAYGMSYTTVHYGLKKRVEFRPPGGDHRK